MEWLEVFQSRDEIWETGNIGAMKGGISRREWFAVKEQVNETKSFSMGFGLGNYYFPLKELFWGTLSMDI